MLIGPSDRFETGVRYSALADLPYIDNPNFSDMMEVIQRGRNETPQS
jgi:hypothetical protein